MSIVDELKQSMEKKSIEDKYPWNRFLEAFTFLKGYHAFVGKVENISYPSVTLVFKNTYRAKCFLYWLQKMGLVDPYQAMVYLEEEVNDIYKDLK